MKSSHSKDKGIMDILHRLKHYVPSQAPLKDFIHHNTLHAFQEVDFHQALHQASSIFGYKVYLSLNEYRQHFKDGVIKEEVLDYCIANIKGHQQAQDWKQKLLHKEYPHHLKTRIGVYTAAEKNYFKVNLEKLIHPTLFRVVSGYLDQGVSIWNFPIIHKTFFGAIKELEQYSVIGFFKSKRVKQLILHTHCKTETLLEMLVGDETFYERYLFDLTFAHQGWSGMVSVLEDNPQLLLDKRTISLEDFIRFELLLKIDLLDRKYGDHWKPLHYALDKETNDLFSPVELTEHAAVMELWQEAFEWSYYNQVLAGLSSGCINDKKLQKELSFQAVFCIDDRECSIRRYLEKRDPNCKTFGTPGFFNMDFYYQPEHSKFYTKVCPAPMDPKHLIKEIDPHKKRSKDAHLETRSNRFVGWLLDEGLGLWSALELVGSIFRPRTTAKAVSSFKHMGKNTTLTIENKHTNDVVHGLQVGFTVEEMCNRAEGLLKSIGLTSNFAPIVYLVGHGASSVNNTHYAGYDCGACSGRPGSVNARVAAFMINHVEVRKVLSTKGIIIPESTQFLGALHDTTRDEVEYYDEDILTNTNKKIHERNKLVFNQSLECNAKERSRRFALINSKQDAPRIHEQIKKRSVSLFEPRPEYNHATNSLCIVGRRESVAHLFLDRRSFLNSYDYSIDPEGKYLLNILRAAAPVCGGINLEYYFSRVDNYKLGAGSKLPHNVMGLIGVANGADGDLRPGLPWQMVEIHDPLRLMIIVEHLPQVILDVIQTSAPTYEWFNKNWVHLIAIHPETKQIFQLKNGRFQEYTLVASPLLNISDVTPLIEQHERNLPVFVINP